MKSPVQLRTVPEAAKALCVAPNTLRRWINDPKQPIQITCYLGGRSPRISEADLRRFVESQPSHRTLGGL